MFDLTLARPTAAAPRDAHFIATTCSANDHEHLGSTSRGARWLTAALDEVDYGIVMLDGSAQVLHVNHTARAELDDAHPLQLVGLALRAREPRTAAQLQQALDDASRRGLRKLLTIGVGDAQISVSIVPLRTTGDDGQVAALLVFGKRRMSGILAVQAFARSHGLTPGETRVLLALCDGVPPAVAAAQHGVAISTVRTQIGSIRAKTGAASIRDLIHKVASLPPLMTALRNGGSTCHEMASLALAA
jgi:DNA-binding CsgD family transcriptional regulator